MPNSAPRPCPYCRAAAYPGHRCNTDQHPPKRLSRSLRGYGRRWQRYRLLYLAEHPLCSDSSHGARPVAATVVDHRIPHRGDYDLMWDERNHQPLCAACHSRKTVLFDGGFGN